MKYIIISIITWIGDFLTKYFVLSRLNWGEVFSIFPGFNLVLYGNRGGAFSMLGNVPWGGTFLAIISTLILIFLGFTLYKATDSKIKISIALIIGGALGNLTDRLLYHQVIDFLDFYWINWHYPAFNIADSVICLGAFLWFWELNRKGKKI